MVEKKSIKIFVASAAAVALVIGLSVGITENNKRQSMNASNAMAYGSQYDCVESTSTTMSKSSKSRRLVVPGTEDYYPSKARVSSRRSLQAEHVRSRGEESRKLGKENIETEMVNEGWGSGGGTHTVVEVDSSDTTSVVEVDSSDTTTTTVVESYVDSSSVDSAIVMTGGSGKSGGSGGSKSGTTSMFVGSKSGSTKSGTSTSTYNGSKSNKDSSTTTVKYCTEVQDVCGMTGGKSNKDGTGTANYGTGKSNKGAGTYSEPGAKSNKGAGTYSEPGAKSNKSAGTYSEPGGKSSKSAGTASSPTISCEVDVETVPPPPTPPVVVPPAPTPIEVVETPNPITSAPTEAIITPEPTVASTELITPAPTEAIITPEPTVTMTELITPMPTPESTNFASVGSTPTVAADSTSEPYSTSLRPPSN